MFQAIKSKCEPLFNYIPFTILSAKSNQGNMPNIIHCLGNQFERSLNLPIQFTAYILSLPAKTWLDTIISQIAAFTLGCAGLGLYLLYTSYPWFKVAVKMTICTAITWKLMNWTLQLAAARGYEKLAKVMILLQADVNRKYSWDNLAPLHYAARSGHAKMITLLVQAGADANLGGGIDFKRGCLNNPPLEYAIYSGNIDAVKVLIIQSKVTLSNEHLNLAISSGHLPVVNMLITEQKLNVNTRARGKSPLHVACENDQTEIFKALVNDFQANIEEEDEEGNRAIHVAVVGGKIDILKFLMEETKATSTATNHHGLNILHLACEKRHLNILRYLLYIKQPLGINSRDKEQNTPLHQFVKYDYTDNAEALELLLKDYQADVNALNSKGETALHQIASRGNLKCFRLILQEDRAQIDLPNLEGQTPLHFALKTTDGENKKIIIQELINKGSNINAQDHLGRTPLHLAMMQRYHNPEFIQSLLRDFHFNINAQDKKGLTPYHIAAIYRISKFIDILKQANADDAIKDELGYSPIDYINMDETKKGLIFT